MSAMSEMDAAIRQALHPLKQWKHRCHEASVELVQKSGIKGLRVARGVCNGVGGQHSWVTMGNPYKPDYIIDPTLWSYNPDVSGVFVGPHHIHDHRPHGSGSIFEWGRPDNVLKSDAYELAAPLGGWSSEARRFLMLLGPIDLRGWWMMAHAPVQGWPAKEIIGAMRADDNIRAHIPIDIVGMLLEDTLIGPGGPLYPRS